MDCRDEFMRLVEKAGLCFEDGAVCRRSGTKTVKMSNFLVVPVADVVKSDGSISNCYASVVVYAARENGVVRMNEVTVSMSELNNMEWVWEKWGLLCRIYPPVNTNKEYLRAAAYENIILPLLSLAFFSPLNEFFRQADCEPAFVLFILGKTQSRKSTLAALILSFSGNSHRRGCR